MNSTIKRRIVLKTQILTPILTSQLSAPADQPGPSRLLCGIWERSEICWMHMGFIGDALQYFVNYLQPLSYKIYDQVPPSRSLTQYPHHGNG